MQNAHILNYILPTFLLVMLALFFDSHIVNYLPIMSPIQSFKAFKQTDHLIKLLIIYFIKWYVVWIFIWVVFHFLLLKGFIQSIRCQKEKQEGSNKERIKQYEVISTSQDNQSKLQLQTIQTIETSTKDLQPQQKLKHYNYKKQQEIKKSFFQSVIYSYSVTFVATFTIVFLTISLVQSQISLISHETKNGSHHSKWMGAREYYTLDFFHNIPSQYQQNHKLMDLFDQQDEAVSTVTNWIANYRLFFGLFHLMFKSLAPIGIVICFLLMFMKIKINLNKDKNKTKKRLKFMSIVKHGSQMSFFNIIFVLFLGFSILSATFLEIKTKNKQQLCSFNQSNGGLILSFDKRIQTQIISQVIKIYPLSDEKTVTSNKHQILFVFENLCQIFTPFYRKVIHLQEIFLFSMRLSEIFFGMSILLLLYSKITQSEIFGNPS